MNDESVVVKNAPDVANGGHIRGVRYSLPRRLAEFNIVDDVRKEMADAGNLDFRPRHDSSYDKLKITLDRTITARVAITIGFLLYKLSSFTRPVLLSP